MQMKDKTGSEIKYGPKRAIRVTERKLGKHRAVGLAHVDDKLIEVDPRQNARDYLDTLVHELLHIIGPSKHWSEDTVKKVANIITLHLWRAGFRRIYD